MPELIEWPCDFPTCQNTVMSYDTSCYWCHGIWCSDHIQNELHLCASAQQIENRQDRNKELQRIKESADAEQLNKLLNQVRQHQDTFIAQAEQIRTGHKCKMEIPSEYHILQESKWFAYCNVHFLILYDDGIKWLLRIRQNRGHRLPSEITTPVIQSEVATLNFLKRHGIPVPGAHLPLHLINDEVHTNTTGLDYFFYEFIEGTPLDLPTTGYFGEISLPEEKLRLFVDEYARINIQLSNLKLPFKQLGCIYPSADRFGEVVGPIVTRGCFMNPKPPHFMGPFHTHKELLLAKIDAALRYSKVNGLQGEDTLDEYLWHLELRELVEASQKLGKIPTELFIKHDDKKGDELMVDENGHMLGIIDWEWAYVTTKEDAFSTPAIFNRTFDFFKNGSNELTYAEKLLIDAYERQGKADLADCVRSSRLYVRLDRIGLYDSAYKKSGFREVFGDDIPKDFSPPGDDIGWRGYMIKRYEHDQNLKEVIQKYGT